MFFKGLVDVSNISGLTFTKNRLFCLAIATIAISLFSLYLSLALFLLFSLMYRCVSMLWPHFHEKPPYSQSWWWHIYVQPWRCTDGFCGWKKVRHKGTEDEGNLSQNTYTFSNDVVGVWLSLMKPLCKQAFFPPRGLFFNSIQCNNLPTHTHKSHFQMTRGLLTQLDLG